MAGRSFTTIAALAALLAVSPRGSTQETASSIVAAQVRAQGFGCVAPKTATRDERASRPDEVAWILVCKNASYRVRLVPDMAAKIEPLKVRTRPRRQ